MTSRKPLPKSIIGLLQFIAGVSVFIGGLANLIMFFVHLGGNIVPDNNYLIRIIIIMAIPIAGSFIAAVVFDDDKSFNNKKSFIRKYYISILLSTIILILGFYDINKSTNIKNLFSSTNDYNKIFKDQIDQCLNNKYINKTLNILNNNNRWLDENYAESNNSIKIVPPILAIGNNSKIEPRCVENKFMVSKNQTPNTIVYLKYVSHNEMKNDSEGNYCAWDYKGIILFVFSFKNEAIIAADYKVFVFEWHSHYKNQMQPADWEMEPVKKWITNRCNLNEND